MSEEKMVTKKSWAEFKETGLFLIINQILHVFGWAIVYEIENDEIKNVYPARVKFRGFDSESVGVAYEKVSKYLKDNINEIHNESKN